jgi:hypothetical protein
LADHAVPAAINSARPAGRAMRLRRVFFECVPLFLFIVVSPWLLYEYSPSGFPIGSMR